MLAKYESFFELNYVQKSPAESQGFSRLLFRFIQVSVTYKNKAQTCHL